LHTGGWGFESPCIHMARVKFDDTDPGVRWFTAVDAQGKPFDRYTYLTPHAAYMAHEGRDMDVRLVQDPNSLYAAHGL
jgi:hypothetical protein